MKTATKENNIKNLENLENYIIAFQDGMKTLLANYNVNTYEELPENGQLIYDGMYKKFKALCDFSNRVSSVLNDSEIYFFQNL